MMTMNNNVLSKVKDEYCQALVERMSAKEMRAYLFQIFSNDVAYDSMDEMRSKITRVFDEEFFDFGQYVVTHGYLQSSGKKARLKTIK